MVNKRINPYAFPGMQFKTVGVTLCNLKPTKGKLTENDKFEIIKEAVFEATGIKFDEILRNKRDRNIAESRQMIQYLCKIYTNYSISEIGRRTNRHHSSVIHSEKVVKNLNETCTDYAVRLGMIFNFIENKINNYKQKVLEK